MGNPDGVQVDRAWYGAGESWFDVTKKVSDEVEYGGLHLNSASASGALTSLFGDPATGVAKVLVIHARGAPGTALMEMRSTAESDGEAFSVHLYCDEAGVLCSNWPLRDVTAQAVAWLRAPLPKGDLSGYEPPPEEKDKAEEMPQLSPAMVASEDDDDEMKEEPPPPAMRPPKRTSSGMGSRASPAGPAPKRAPTPSRHADSAPVRRSTSSTGRASVSSERSASRSNRSSSTGRAPIRSASTNNVSSGGSAKKEPFKMVTSKQRAELERKADVERYKNRSKDTVAQAPVDHSSARKDARTTRWIESVVVASLIKEVHAAPSVFVSVILFYFLPGASSLVSADGLLLLRSL